MPTEHLEPAFVEFIPVQLTAGQLYVSMEYATTAHLCPCGCGSKVMLPLQPAQWKLCYDGGTVSMSPSVGNWQYPCRSHYRIRQNQIQWAEQWTDQQIDRGDQRDRADVGGAVGRTSHCRLPPRRALSPAITMEALTAAHAPPFPRGVARPSRPGG